MNAPALIEPTLDALAAEINAAHTEAQASALATVLKTSASDLATKQDIDRIEARVNLFEERSEGRFKLLQWMMAFNLGIGVAVLWVLIRTATH